MKFGAMLSDVLQSLVKAPVTERYPFQKKAAPERLRGKLLWQRESCTGCGLCAKDCPANALEVIAIDKKAKKIVMHYDVDHCIFCGPVLETLTAVLNEMGISKSSIQIINVDENPKITEEDLPALPTIQMGMDQLSGFLSEDDLREAVSKMVFMSGG